MKKYIDDINSESQELNKHCNYVVGTLNSLESYYKEYTIRTDEYLIKMRDLNNRYIEESKSSIEKTTFYYKDLNKSLINQIESDYSFFDSLSKKNELLSITIIKPLGEVKANLKESYLENLQELKKIKNSFIKARNNLDELQLNYYKESENLEDMEEQFEKCEPNSDMYETLKTNLKDQRSLVNKSLENYQNELNNYNTKIKEINSDYQNFHTKIEILEESIISFIKGLFTKIESQNKNNDSNSSSSFSEYNIEGDLSVFKENFHPKFESINEEKFVHFENYRLNHPKERNSNKNELSLFLSNKNSKLNRNLIINNDNNEKESEINKNLNISLNKKEPSNKGSVLSNLLKLYPYLSEINNMEFCSTYDSFTLFESGLIRKNKDEKESDPDIDLIDSFVSLVLTNTLIDKELMKEVKSRTSDINFMKLFIESFLKLKEDSFYPILNRNNFFAMKHIIFLYLEKLNNKSIENDFLLNQAIINVCERTYHQKQSVYLCATLGRNDFVTNLNNWKHLLESKIIYKIQKKADKVLIAQKDTNPKGGLFNTLSSFFKFDSGDHLNDDDVEDYLLKIFGFSVKIKNYNNLSKENKMILDKEFKTVFHDSLQEYIEHLCNFNQQINNIISFIFDIRNKYNLSEDNFNYYLQFAYSSTKSIRNLRYFKVNVEKKRIIKTKILSMRSNIKENNSLMANSNKEINASMNKTNKQKKQILSSVMKYLSKSETISLYTLNKEISIKLKKKNYIQILSTLTNQENDLATRLKIWHILLSSPTTINEDKINKVNKINKNDYDSLLSKEKESVANNDYAKVIEVDVKRTSFKSNEQENREHISNILLCLNKANEAVKYFQGLNYITAFAFVITKNEEEAFDIVYNLLNVKDYNMLFIDNLEMLKNYFFLFERLLKLYLPHIYYLFKDSGVKVNFYLSPWLITLFTNICQYNKCEIPTILLNIWDEFLVYGWKGLFTNVLSMISIHEEEIEKKKGDDLFIFLINELCKSNKFEEQNYQAWINEKKKFKITKEVLKGLEEENKLEKLAHGEK